MQEKTIIGVFALVIVGAFVFYVASNGGVDFCEMFNYGCEATDGEPEVQQYPVNQYPVSSNQPTNVNVNLEGLVGGDSGTAALPIETLKVSAKDKYTMADATGKIHFYTVGADVSDPNVKPLDSITISGTGNTTNYIIQTNLPYDVYWNGSSTYYDEKISNWKINYNPDRGVGYLMFGTASYYPAVAVGTFQGVDSLPEVQDNGTCVIDVGSNAINYSNTGCSASMWIKMDIGNSAANTELHDVVLCFTDSDGDMEGDEVSALTATPDSGSTDKIVVPSTLGGYWKEGMGSSAKRCVKIASNIGSTTARYKFAYTVDETNFDEATEEDFEMKFDDLGDISQKQYPSWNAKATAVTLTIQTEA